MNTQKPHTVDFVSGLAKALQCSRYAQRILQADALLLSWLENNYNTPCNGDEIHALLAQSKLNLQDEAQLTKAVRYVRKQVMVKLIFRDLNTLADLNEVMHCMTALAEICVRLAQHCLMSALQAQFGQPIGASSGTAQQMLVIGMGKLGGGELNVSSDIDLIFVYAEDGETQAMAGQSNIRSLSNHEFFTRLGRRLINLIHEPTVDGYVFRVDMRLRPYGDSGPLVMSFAALEEYLVSQGREWERYAWIKARVIAPEQHTSSSELMQLAQPFVFRKYLDFGAIDSMRKLHAQIRQEVARRDRQNNIKLGPGGIREIEFTAQVFQLIRGGRAAKLRIRPTLSVLQQLASDGEITAETVRDLTVAYIFLRNLEHRLQYLDDQQTQDIPDNEDDRARLAIGMGYANYAALLQRLDVHRAIVSAQFAAIFRTETAASDESLRWDEALDESSLSQHLQGLGYADSTAAAQQLLQFRASSRYQQLPEASRVRMAQLIPQFIRACAQQANPDVTLLRLQNLIDSIARRASYLAFLAEYPQALTRLSQLVSASSWAADYLASHPALFDELLDARELYQVPDWAAIDAHVAAQLHDCGDDLERQMDALRHAQQEQIFHLLAMDLQGLLPLEILSDHLSALADLMLRHVLNVCWQNARKKHCDTPHFAIIAFGKLGGKELGYESDLDLIFIYDDTHADAQENYARLAQRINTVLGSYTPAGRLYETDLRLRPNGASGLLVSSLSAFADYQANDAWVWEHQALTRARFCAGDNTVGEAFEVLRNTLLQAPRDEEKLRAEIVAMRQKMHDGHPNNSELFDIKHDAGGMVDIEFMVQFLVLAHAHRYPQLTANIGNLALLRLAGELGLIPAELAALVSAQYRTLRRTQHAMRLNGLSPCRVKPDSLEKSPTLTLWGDLFDTPK
ncbi:MAG: bifunctional [glutamate--ammonia ligase]-adenylyl-L-tyrosine phosphorylase/[glutamate--ammonia-ligase] adenylyltransferase [Gallionella sp.]